MTLVGFCGIIGLRPLEMTKRDKVTFRYFVLTRNLLEKIMSLEKTAVSEAVAKLTGQQVAIFKSLGAVFAENEISLDSSLDSFKENVIIGVEVDYYLWEAGSLEWKQGYAETKHIKLYMTDNTLNPTVKSAWSRYTKALGDKYGIVKPTKPTSTASAKASQRAGNRAKVEELKSKSFEDLETLLKGKLVHPTTQSINEAKPIQQAIEAKKQDIIKAENEETKAIKRALVEWMNDQSYETLYNLATNLGAI